MTDMDPIECAYGYHGFGDLQGQVDILVDLQKGVIIRLK